MKRTGKGKGISIHGGLNDTNAWKQRIEAQTNAPLRVRPFVPLKVAPHPRQREIDEYRAWPSRYAI